MATKILRSIPEYLRDGTNINIFVDAINREIELLEVAALDVKSKIQIETATGDYLNDIGKLFGLSRQANETDDLFRSRISSHLNSLNSSGAASDIELALSSGLGIPIDDVAVTDGTLLKMVITIQVDDDSILEIFNNVCNIVTSSKAAGVCVEDTVFESRGGLFRTNLSKYNGDDLII